MTLEGIIAIIALVASLGSVVWTVWYNINSNQSNKTNKTTEMLMIFNRAAFHHSRGIAWDLLEEVNQSKQSITFQMLWEAKEKAETHKFEQLYSVLSFWHMLFILGEQDEVNKVLANRLFSYEYYWWSKQATRLITNTLNSGEEIPDVAEVFVKAPYWLQRKKLKH